MFAAFEEGKDCSCRDDVAPSERELVARAIAGDENALCEMLDRHEPGLRSRLVERIPRLFQPAFGVDDILQVTYVEAFLRISLFKPDGPRAFPEWVRQIAENNLKDGLKELNREKRPPRAKQIHINPDGDSHVDLLKTLIGPGHTPSQDAVLSEGKGLLEEALDKLPEDYALVVRLYDLMELSGAEVAGRMDRSIGAIRMLRARAHDRLIKLLGESTNFFPKRA